MHYVQEGRSCTALNTTGQILTITSQLLMIGIEVAFIAGGVYVVKNVMQSSPSVEAKELMVIEPQKSTVKDKLAKAKKIISAIIG